MPFEPAPFGSPEPQLLYLPVDVDAPDPAFWVPNCVYWFELFAKGPTTQAQILVPVLPVTCKFEIEP